MLHTREPSFDHLTASVQLYLTVLVNYCLFLLKGTTCKYLRKFKKEQKGHDWSLAIMWYAMASLRQPCEAPQHFIENGCIHVLLRKSFSTVYNVSVNSNWVHPPGNLRENFFERANPRHPGNFCLIPVPRGDDGRISGGCGKVFPNSEKLLLKFAKKSLKN